MWAVSAMRSKSSRLRSGLIAVRLSRSVPSPRVACWKTTVALPRSSPSSAACSAPSTPSLRMIVPSVAGTSPARARSSVVLPDPERPTTTVTVPGLRSRFTSRRPMLPSGWVTRRPRATTRGACGRGLATATGVVAMISRTRVSVREISSTPPEVPETTVICSTTRSRTMMRVAAAAGLSAPLSKASHVAAPYPSRTSCRTRLKRDSPGICHSSSLRTRPRVVAMASPTSRSPTETLRAVRSAGWAQANSNSLLSSSSVAREYCSCALDSIREPAQSANRTNTPPATVTAATGAETINSPAPSAIVKTTAVMMGLTMRIAPDVASTARFATRVRSSPDIAGVNVDGGQERIASGVCRWMARITLMPSLSPRWAAATSTPQAAAMMTSRSATQGPAVIGCALKSSPSNGNRVKTAVACKMAEPAVRAR